MTKQGRIMPFAIRKMTKSEGRLGAAGGRSPALLTFFVRLIRA